MNNSNNLVDDCDDKNPLGEGAFGIVYLCGNTEEEVNTYVVKDKKRYAIKFVKNLIEQNDNEIKMLEYIFYDSNGNKRARAWTNENIVKYYKLKETEIAKLTTFYKTYVSPADTIYHMLKFEYCNQDFSRFYRELIKPDNIHIINFNNIQDKKLRAKLDFRKQVFNGLYYLFGRSIVHYDIKPENILVSLSSVNSPTYKIADFGTSFIYKYDNIVPNIMAGSYYYQPVEFNIESGTFFPLYFTTFARDLYAFFICLDISFNGDADENLIAKYLNNFHTNQGTETIKLTEFSKLDKTPVNDITEEEYSNLYDRLKRDFDTVDEIRNSTIRHRGGSKKRNTRRINKCITKCNTKKNRKGKK